jgi:ParB-like chromosome segregation protein Spo0J
LTKAGGKGRGRLILVRDIMEIQKIAEAPFHWVDPNNIECPGPYCMSFCFDLDPLILSIRTIGLVNSPLLIDNGRGGMTVIAGFRRIQALRSLKYDEIPCRIFSESQLSPLECVLINLHDNLATRTLNVVEKGMILTYLAALLPRMEILEHYMALLGLPSHEPTFIFFERLERDLDDEIKEYLAKGLLSLPVVRVFLDMDPNTRSHVFDIISKLKLNINQQRQLVEYLVDITNMNSSSSFGLFKETEFMRICSDDRLNNPQKAKAVLEFLRARRFPFLTRTEKAFKNKVDRLNLPDGIRIKAPPYFEAPDYRLEVFFKEGKELVEKIRALSQTDGLEDIGDPWERPNKRF